MRRELMLAVALITALGIGSEVVTACGDKFLLVGRGISFQRAYAAIHPASILIVLPPKGVQSAAVRDRGLHKALKMAGHRVEVVQQPANLAEILARSSYAIVLVERADASAVRAAAPASAQPSPSIVAVVEQQSPADLSEPGPDLEYVVKTPQPVSHILNLLDDVIKARLDGSRRAAAQS